MAFITRLLVLFFISPALSANEDMGQPADAPFEDIQLFGEMAFPPLAGLLIAGTSGNSANPNDTENGIVLINLETSEVVFNAPMAQVWGAAADPLNRQVFFSVASNSLGSLGGDELFVLSYDGGKPVSLGVILNPVGEPLRMDGLAVSGDNLFAALDGQPGGGDPDGLYLIDIENRSSSLVMPLTGIGGLDSDPESGRLFGADDDLGQLVEIDPVQQKIIVLTDYPAKTGDFDALAALPGLVFLIADEDQLIEVYDLEAQAYQASLPAAFLTPDTFAGATIAFEIELPLVFPPAPVVPTLNRFGLLTLLVMMVMIALIKKRTLVKTFRA